MPLTPINIKIYAAILNQADTNNPVATVLQNTISPINLTWTRLDVGKYRGQLTGLLPRDKLGLITGQNQGAFSNLSLISDSDPNSVMLEQASTSVSINLDGLTNQFVEIRVYTEPQHE